jgi:hypothetical protein
MRTELAFTSGLKALALAGAAVLSLTAGEAFAQAPRAGGPPPGAFGPGGRGGGPPPGAPNDGFDPLLISRGAPPTAAQQLVAKLPPPQSDGAGKRVVVLEPDSPMPASDPRDLNGTWFHNQGLEFRMQKDMFGHPLPYTDAGAKVLERRVISLNEGKPFSNASAICRPPGQQWQHDLNMPWQIFQSKDWIELVFEEYHGRWQVVMNPAAHPKPAEKQYMGYSVGRWDGNTLVVETTDLKQGVYLDVDGTPLSRNGKLISRIRKVDNGDRQPYLEIVTTVIDPLYYTQPWSNVRIFSWQPKAVFREYDCEEQVGDPAGGPDGGLVHEPAD